MTARMLEIDQKREGLVQEVRNYHRLEKSLESTLGRSLKKKVEQQRDQLLSKFGRKSYQAQLPVRLRQRAEQHKTALDNAEALKRSLSRGRGLER